MSYNQHPRPSRSDRDHAAILARFPSVGWRERERLRDVATWSEMAGTNNPSSKSGSRSDHRRLTLSERFSHAPIGLMLLIASALLIVGLLSHAIRTL
jgi:hypothetical protein